MVKLYALNKILRGKDQVIDPAVEPVFDATPDEAKQFDALKSARPATADEVAKAKDRAAKKDGTAFLASPEPVAASAPAAEVDAPESGANGDPKSAPKGRNS